MYIFSRLPQIFRKPTVAIPGRNGGLFTWELYAFSSRDKFQLGQMSRDEFHSGLVM